MLTTEQHHVYFWWAQLKLKAEFKPEHGCRVLADINEDGEIRAVLMYHRFSETNCEMAIASDSKGHWMTRQGLRLAFTYPFIQLKLARVTAVIENTNRRSLKLAGHLGFITEGLLRDWFGTGRDGILMGMTRKDCRWI